MAPPPSKPTFQPFVEESDEPPTMWVTTVIYKYMQMQLLTELSFILSQAFHFALSPFC